MGERTLLADSDDLLPHDQSRDGADAARARIETDELAVRRFEKEPVAVHANAAIADGASGVRRVLIMPDFTAGTRVHRPDVICDGEVKHALHQQRIGLDPPSLPGLLRLRHGPKIHSMGPHHRQRPDVGLVDLFERTVTLARVIAIKGGPGVGRRRFESRGFEQLPEQTGWQQGENK